MRVEGEFKVGAVGHEARPVEGRLLCGEVGEMVRRAEMVLEVSCERGVYQEGVGGRGAVGEVEVGHVVIVFVSVEDGVDDPFEVALFALLFSFGDSFRDLGAKELSLSAM